MSLRLSGKYVSGIGLLVLPSLVDELLHHLGARRADTVGVFQDGPVGAEKLRAIVTRGDQHTFAGIPRCKLQQVLRERWPRLVHVGTQGHLAAVPRMQAVIQAVRVNSNHRHALAPERTGHGERDQAGAAITPVGIRLMADDECGAGSPLLGVSHGRSTPADTKTLPSMMRRAVRSIRIE